MVQKGLIVGLGLLSFAPFASAEEPKLHISGSFEQFMVSGNILFHPTTRDRFSRGLIAAESGNWKLQVSHWYYPAAKWYDLDETTLTYQANDLRLRVGRLLTPLAQSNWDDEWYTGFVFIPFLEFSGYGGYGLLERTSAGADAAYVRGNNTLKVALVGSDPVTGKPFPKAFDRAVFKWQTTINNLILGFSTLVDTASTGKEQQIQAFDYRWTVPQWTVRGTVIGGSSPTEFRQGMYTDVYHRPKGWSDVTLVYRFEHMITNTGVNAHQEIQTVGAKIRLPFATNLNVNYTYGPDMSNVPLGGGVSLALYKTFKF